MNDSDIIWAAGIIDGEGCIRLSKNGNYYYPRLTVEMTHKPTIVRLHEMLGGSIHKVKRNRKMRYERTLWVFDISSVKLGNIIEMISPYIFTKKDEFDIIKEYYQMYKSKTKRYFTSEDIIYFSLLKEKCSKCKKVEYD